MKTMRYCTTCHQHLDYVSFVKAHADHHVIMKNLKLTIKENKKTGIFLGFITHKDGNVSACTRDSRAEVMEWANEIQEVA